MSVSTTATSTTTIIVLRNGRVVDKHNGIDGVGDVYIENGFIKEVRLHSVEGEEAGEDGGEDKNADAAAAAATKEEERRDGGLGIETGRPGSSTVVEFDVAGCVVTAGLVDCHVHVYQHATPLGVDVDRTCLSRGVTTVVDAGSSGAMTFPGLRKFIVDQSQTRVFAFLHIAKHGLAAAACSGLSPGGECDSLNAVCPETCHKVIQDNKDVIVGVKVRLAASITDEGKNEQEVFRRSLQAAARSSVPLMVHHALSTVHHEAKGDLLGCPASLRPGDIYTHCFHGHQGSIVDRKSGRVSEVVWEAKKRGVVFDIGHGQGSFSWHVAEQCVSEGFWPDTVSTDLHTESQHGPSYDLLNTMTKMMHLGMPLGDVIAAVTSRPAQVIGKLSELGHLGVGMRADVTVLRLVDLDPAIQLEDSFGETRSVPRAFEVVSVFLGGRQHPVSPLRPWPNPKIVQECRQRRSKYANMDSVDGN